MTVTKDTQQVSGKSQTGSCKCKCICKGISAVGIIFIAIAVLLTGCVTTANHCGNEQRDWSNLQFPKDKYCSVPGFVPFVSQYEGANKSVCKVHDNNSGKYATMSQREADKRFLCDYIKHSEFPWGVRHVTGYLSYFTLRANAISESNDDSHNNSNSNNSNDKIEQSTEASTAAVLIDGTDSAIKTSDGQTVSVE